MISHKLAVEVSDRDFARSIAGALQECVEPTPGALTIFEQGIGCWRIEAYYAADPGTLEIEHALTSLLGQPIPALALEHVPDLNWVAMSQAALPPVHAGRFTVHGSHDAGRVPRGPGAILIDAGEAFGTAHHATTYGCLMAISQLTRRHRFRRVLDLGCGSGVLAIAVRRALPHAIILATDIDEKSVAVAAENVRRNGAGGGIRGIRVFAAGGLDHPRLRAVRFDLVIANILAAPLIAMARQITHAVEPGGMLLLSGLLTAQAPAVIAAYRAAGCVLEAHHRHNGWSTLILANRTARYG